MTMIAPNDVALVQKSWKQVTPISNTAAELFYGKLFSLDPEIRQLFKGDMKEQGRKLMAMITTAVNGLARIDAVVGRVRHRGRRGWEGEPHRPVGRGAPLELAEEPVEEHVGPAEPAGHEVHPGAVAEEHGVAVVVLNEQSREVSVSNNNSICRILTSSPKYAPRCGACWRTGRSPRFPGARTTWAFFSGLPQLGSTRDASIRRRKSTSSCRRGWNRSPRRSGSIT